MMAEDGSRMAEGFAYRQHGRAARRTELVEVGLVQDDASFSYINKGQVTTMAEQVKVSYPSL